MIEVRLLLMSWVVGNIPQYTTIETFSSEIRTKAPITGEDSIYNEFSESVPKTIEDWIEAQNSHDNFKVEVQALNKTATTTDGL